MRPRGTVADFETWLPCDRREDVIADTARSDGVTRGDPSSDDPVGPNGGSR